MPCTPSNVLPTVDCITNALVVSWTPSAGGEYYTATLQDSNGLSTTCQSMGSKCNVTGLRCGQLYHVNVTASDSLCISPPSATVNTNSGKHIQAYTCLYTLYFSFCRHCFLRHSLQNELLYLELLTACTLYTVSIKFLKKVCKTDSQCFSCFYL